MPHIAVVIVHYNGEIETRECLESLKHLKPDNFTFSVVVVDNASKEPLVIPEEKLPPNTTILRSDTNLGFTSGNNLGVAHILKAEEIDYVLLLNNDTTVEPNFLTRMLACAESTDKPGIIAPKIYFSPGREFHKQSYTQDQKGKVFWYAGGSVDWRNIDAFHRGVDEVDYGQFDSKHESDFATGCCALIPKAVIDRVGLLEKKYFLYLEDVDLSMRIQQAGYKIIFCPEAVIWHKNAGSSGGSGSSLHQYYQTRNRLFFFWKYAWMKKKGSLLTQLLFQFFLLRFAWKMLLKGDMMERKGTRDWILGRMGKQLVL